MFSCTGADRRKAPSGCFDSGLFLEAGSGAPQFIATEQGYSISHYPGAVSPDSRARVCLVSL